MTKILYIDPVFGISGDMMISALVDAGVPFEVLEGLLSRLPSRSLLSRLRVHAGVSSRGSISG
jgi:uncharacterized protein (DUF111 family)